MLPEPKYDKYDIILDGVWLGRLNDRLARNQHVSDDQLEALRISHQVKHKLFEEAKRTQDGKRLRELAVMFEELEFLQQEAWNFEQDRKFHRWFDLPGCTCPKLDNGDRVGASDERIISTDCPAHNEDPWSPA